MIAARKNPRTAADDLRDLDASITLMRDKMMRATGAEDGRVYADAYASLVHTKLRYLESEHSRSAK